MLGGPGVAKLVFASVYGYCINIQNTEFFEAPHGNAEHQLGTMKVVDFMKAPPHPDPLLPDGEERGIYYWQVCAITGTWARATRPYKGSYGDTYGTPFNDAGWIFNSALPAKGIPAPPPEE